MDTTLLVRIGAITFVAVAITATMIGLTHEDEPAPVRSMSSPGVPADPLRADLRRCQLLGEAAVSDPGCLATWAESRDRFLGVAPAPAGPRDNGGR